MFELSAMAPAVLSGPPCAAVEGCRPTHDKVTTVRRASAGRYGQQAWPFAEEAGGSPLRLIDASANTLRPWSTWIFSRGVDIAFVKL